MFYTAYPFLLFVFGVACAENKYDDDNPPPSIHTWFPGVPPTDPGVPPSPEPTDFFTKEPQPPSISCPKVCFDSPLRLANNEKLKKCKQVIPKDACSRYGTHCRSSCDMCGECLDSDRMFHHVGHMVPITCYEVEQTQKESCKILGLAITCPFTCGICTTSA